LSSNRRHRPPIPHGVAVPSSDSDPAIDAITTAAVDYHAISPSSSDPPCRIRLLLHHSQICHSDPCLDLLRLSCSTPFLSARVFPCSAEESTRADG
jgi:hypothetical protein